MNKARLIRFAGLLRGWSRFASGLLFSNPIVFRKYQVAKRLGTQQVRRRLWSQLLLRDSPSAANRLGLTGT
jgi:hypothetical protein